MDSQTTESTCPGCGESISQSSEKCYDCAKDDTQDTKEITVEQTNTENQKHSLFVRVLESLSLTSIMLTLSTSMGNDDEDGVGAVGAIMLLLFVPMVREWIEERLGITLSGVQFWIVTLTLGFVGYFILTLI